MLILAIGTLVLNRTLFIHVHILPDGTMVVHAHPSGKTDDQDGGRNHSHTGGELLILQHQDLLYGCETAPEALILPGFDEEREEIVGGMHIMRLPLTRPGRAPPFS